MPSLKNLFGSKANIPTFGTIGAIEVLKNIAPDSIWPITQISPPPPPPHFELDEANPLAFIKDKFEKVKNVEEKIKEIRANKISNDETAKILKRQSDQLNMMLEAQAELYRHGRA